MREGKGAMRIMPANDGVVFGSSAGGAMDDGRRGEDGLAK